jgi:hypothetical protein
VIRRTPVSVLAMRQRMCRRESLYWHLKRKPSEDMSNTTSFVELGERPHGSGCRITTVRDERSKMKVVAAARAMAWRSRRGGERLGCGHGGGEDSGGGPWRVAGGPDLH